MAHYDLVLISPNGELKTRVETLCKEFEYSWTHTDSVDSFVEGESNYEHPLLIILDLRGLQTSSEAAGAVQVIRQFKVDVHITAIASKKVPTEEAAFIKKSGASQVILEAELPESSKLEFVSSQVIRSTFIPIKVSEIKLGSTVDFPVFALLPLNRKFVSILASGSVVARQPLYSGQCNYIDKVFMFSSSPRSHAFMASAGVMSPIAP